MRTALNAWIDRTFGPIHAGDLFTMNEEVRATKEEGICDRQITVALRKNEAIKKDWTSEETFIRWKMELREIVGNDGLKKFDLKCSEGNELNYIAGIRRGEKGKEEFIDASGKLYSYRFSLSIIKRTRKSGG